MDTITICCNVGCAERHSCAQFARAMDVNSGKIAFSDNVRILDKCSYEKAK